MLYCICKVADLYTVHTYYVKQVPNYICFLFLLLLVCQSLQKCLHVPQSLACNYKFLIMSLCNIIITN